jgi:hypothetical protein
MTSQVIFKCEAKPGDQHKARQRRTNMYGYVPETKLLLSGMMYLS